MPLVLEVRHSAIDYYLSDGTLLIHFQHRGVCCTMENFSQHHSNYSLCEWVPGSCAAGRLHSLMASLVHSQVQQILTEHLLCAKL